MLAGSTVRSCLDRHVSAAAGEEPSSGSAPTFTRSRTLRRTPQRRSLGRIKNDFRCRAVLEQHSVKQGEIARSTHICLQAATVSPCLKQTCFQYGSNISHFSSLRRRANAYVGVGPHVGFGEAATGERSLFFAAPAPACRSGALTAAVLPASMVAARQSVSLPSSQIHPKGHPY